MTPEQHYKHVASPHAAEMINALLTADVGRRLGNPSRGEIRAHPFFWGLDWERLERRQVEPPHADFSRERAREVKKVFHAEPEPARKQIGFM